jgi:hypothetical protein
MVITKKYINGLRHSFGWLINEELESILLEKLEKCPCPENVYTEQDIFEQSRKIIYDYHEKNPEVKRYWF